MLQPLIQIILNANINVVTNSLVIRKMAANIENNRKSGQGQTQCTHKLTVQFTLRRLKLEMLKSFEPD